MKNRFSLLFIIATSFLLAGCTVPFIEQKSGLQVTVNPQANIFLDGKALGQSPYYSETLKAGQYTVKVNSTDPSLSSWEGKVTLNPGVLTYVERQLASDLTKAHGYILSFEQLTKKDSSEVSIISSPDTISVTIDGVPAGFTPTKTDSVTVGPHTFTLTTPGFQEKIIKASVKAGQRLVINAQLATQTIVPVPVPTIEPVASPSAAIVPNPTIKGATITPLPKQASTSAVPKPYVEILATPDNNHLKIRSENVIGNNIIAIINTGDRFPFIQKDTEGKWIQIYYQDQLKGWVFAQYVKLVQ
jgi:uncharacterized protein YgiM (DUF1202 family)